MTAKQMWTSVVQVEDPQAFLSLCAVSNTMNIKLAGRNKHTGRELLLIAPSSSLSFSTPSPGILSMEYRRRFGAMSNPVGS